MLRSAALALLLSACAGQAPPPPFPTGLITTTVVLNPMEALAPVSPIPVGPNASFPSGASGLAVTSLTFDGVTPAAVDVNGVATSYFLDMATLFFCDDATLGRLTGSALVVGAAMGNGSEPVRYVLPGTNLTGRVQVSAAHASAILNGLAYLTLYSTDFPTGLLRGQIAFANIGLAVLVGAQESPAVSSSVPYGLASFSIDPIGFTLTLISLRFYGGGTPNGTQTFLMGPAAPGASGSQVCDFNQGTWNFQLYQRQCNSPSPPFNDSSVADLRNGLYYLQVQTLEAPGGAFRGQVYFPSMFDQLNVFGATMTPSATLNTPTSALGAAVLFPLTSGGSTYVVFETAANLTSSQTLFHLHVGNDHLLVQTVLGAAAYAPLSLTAAQQAMLIGSVPGISYWNVHTSGNPSGECMSAALSAAALPNSLPQPPGPPPLPPFPPSPPSPPVPPPPPYPTQLLTTTVVLNPLEALYVYGAGGGAPGLVVVSLTLDTTVGASYAADGSPASFRVTISSDWYLDPLAAGVTAAKMTFNQPAGFAYAATQTLPFWLNGTFTVSAADANSMINGTAYISLLTASRPFGIVRGQVCFSNVGMAVLVSAQQLPALPPGSQPSYGLVSVLVNDATGRLTVTMRLYGGAVPGLKTYLHGPASPGYNGSMACDLTPGAWGGGTLFNSHNCNATFTTAQLVLLRQGAYYLSVYSSANIGNGQGGGGALRGQVFFPSLFEGSRYVAGSFAPHSNSTTSAAGAIVLMRMNAFGPIALPPPAPAFSLPQASPNAWIAFWSLATLTSSLTSLRMLAADGTPLSFTGSLLADCFAAAAYLPLVSADTGTSGIIGGTVSAVASTQLFPFGELTALLMPNLSLPISLPSPPSPPPPPPPPAPPPPPPARSPAFSRPNPPTPPPLPPFAPRYTFSTAPPPSLTAYWIGLPCATVGCFLIGATVLHFRYKAQAAQAARAPQRLPVSKDRTVKELEFSFSPQRLERPPWQAQGAGPGGAPGAGPGRAPPAGRPPASVWGDAAPEGRALQLGPRNVQR